MRLFSGVIASTARPAATALGSAPASPPKFVSNSHSSPSALAAKMAAITLHPDTGGWDYVTIYPLAGGITDLEFTNISPSDAKWWALVEKKLGGPDKALAMGHELQRLIARQNSYLAHEHLDTAK